ncbi:MAG: PQQ-binding-like beta-propeller repeat protein [Verrucomicrobia bacterium]|nr:PQQ-binding-like beta-propeller repeat protein [Verrucomicrobiota bacterium]MDA1066338.1 PQQ-binding-like beta-propeller repeat protein [Verrucomicrobiota bacterium]
MNSHKTQLAGLLTALFISGSYLNAEDWPHWLGPNGDNIVEAADNFDPDLKNWKIAWQTDVGLGYSTVTSANGKAYTMGHDGKSSETIICFNAATGEKIWDHTYSGQLIPAMHVGGPNASVTVSGDVVYTVSKDGRVLCLNATSGAVLWSTQLTGLLDMEVPKWGFGSSPVEYQGDLIISAGKTVALDKSSGRPSWVSDTAYRPGYGSPVVFENDGNSFIASMDSSGLSILDASNGKEVARHEVRSKYTMVATTPAVFNNGKDIYIFTDMTTEVLKFDGKSLTSEWEDKKLKGSLSGSLLIDGTLYGLNGTHKNNGTSLFARNIDTGEEIWSEPNFGFASMIAVGDTLVILTEDGELVTAPVNAREFKEISRKKLLDAICWTNPTYVGGRIFVRNEHGVLIVLERA